MVVFGRSACIRAKLLNSGKSDCIGANWLYSGKVVVFGQKRYYSNKSGCIEAATAVFGQK